MKKVGYWSCAIVASGLLGVANAFAGPEAIDKWLSEFSPSTLSKEEQKKELAWFAKAAEPFKEKQYE